MRDIIEGVLGGASKSRIFKDESKLTPEYLPRRLPCREKQLYDLAMLFKPLIESPGSVSQRVIITGPVGVGKTSLSKRFGLDLEGIAEERNIKLCYVHVNCYINRSLFDVVRTIAVKVASTIGYTIPKRGLSISEVLDLVRTILRKENMYLLVTLDDLDFASDIERILYNLVRLSEEEVEGVYRFNYIFIMKDTCLLYALDEKTRSSLLHNIIELEPYVSKQLYLILKDRINEAFRPGVVKDEIPEMISETIGYDNGGPGNARYAIEILWRAGKYAEIEGDNQVRPEHVRRAIKDIPPYTITLESTLERLRKHELLLLLAIAKSLKLTDKSYVTMGEVEKMYNMICEEVGEKPRKHTQVYEYIRRLEALGFISRKRSGRGFRGKTSLISLGTIKVGIHNIPLTILIRKIEEALSSTR